MLILLEARTKSNKLLSLPLQDPVNGISIEDIEGLDPVNANIVSSKFAGLDGEQYQASRRDKRNILLTLGMDPKYQGDTVQGLRKNLYEFFMPKTQINLRFYVSDNPYVAIDGRVESFEAPLFVKAPSAKISVLCMNPDFVMSTAATFNGYSVSSSTETPLEYIGSVSTGFTFQTTMSEDIDGFELYNRTPDGIVRSLILEYAFLDGDVVKISTVPGGKYVNLLRAGIESSILYAMTPSSSWLSLEPGTNNIRVVAEGAAIPYTIVYNNRFGGL